MGELILCIVTIVCIILFLFIPPHSIADGWEIPDIIEEPEEKEIKTGDDVNEYLENLPAGAIIGVCERCDYTCKKHECKYYLK